jgi:AraC-like DNA-binding protein/mannose-6-phosphate isomerase-like protein (cupin superfamily)
MPLRSGLPHRAESVFREPWEDTLFTDLFRSIRVRHSAYFRPTFAAPWGVRFEGTVTHFHFVVSGTCWLSVRGLPEATRLTAGDFVIVPRGKPHALCDPPGTPSADFFELARARTVDESGAFSAGGVGSVTRFLCGGMELENGATHMLLAVLSPLIHLKGQAGGAPRWLEATSSHLLEELEHVRPFRDTVVTRFADILVIQAVRAYLADQTNQVQSGWLAALRDRRVGQALALMHSQPDERWTVGALAARLAISRSAFAEKFSRLLGESPHRYLARLRLNIASQRLRTTDDKISVIAASAGYKSLPAFSKAFKQELGVSPVEYRRKGDGLQQLTCQGRDAAPRNRLGPDYERRPRQK